ncbi:5-(carboxyamino)imidazole ribonucleotide synthase [Nannocystis sp. ILAH1]|uniref:5-(carboxyamino)imidazole ribonucleotide synthase n=1 Tax=unclassified Nannocystis TaxID=2627009 RepID=UPI00226EB419|nr:MULTISPECIES: 5-(carboxyamino)imidazole ribonucleotide synthase [unclassified Nannocystis]MCY0995222.1 5-(carboxyamino)imidazole ribonucleotide synthase [Nannocystis sp. ILAH1]MCY1068156.1 5-(carboxyamino)imidazole ribonucleotide synthase [Nannocystis sp. RBIL2]
MRDPKSPILPGATIGVLGSGQLGRMFAIAARRLGYRVHTYSPDVDTPTGQVADLELRGPYDDLAAVRAFASAVDVVTFEFENVPAATVEAAAAVAPVRPAGSVLHTTQHRLREKTYLKEHGFPVTPFRAARSAAEVAAAMAEVGRPALLKTAGWGYDGKGQVKIEAPEQAAAAWAALQSDEAIVEAWVPYACELSVVGVRGHAGETAVYAPVENQHVRGILDLSLAPARVAPEVAAEAQAIARRLLESLAVVGVLCVEFFCLPGGALLINELAPRPHNSGHLTIDACVTCQFEQQLRAVCGLPLGSTELLRPAAMANLLGDVWQGGTPDWAAALALPDVKLHLYGKSEARVGRKMGHLTALGPTAEGAAARVLEARARLTRSPEIPDSRG